MLLADQCPADGVCCPIGGAPARSAERSDAATGNRPRVKCLSHASPRSSGSCLWLARTGAVSTVPVKLASRTTPSQSSMSYPGAKAARTRRRTSLCRARGATTTNTRARRRLAASDLNTRLCDLPIRAATRLYWRPVNEIGREISRARHLLRVPGGAHHQ